MTATHRKLSLCIASGLLLGLAFPPIPTGVTAFVAFVPLLFCLESAAKKTRVFKYSYITFLVLNLSTVYWISGWTGTDDWLKVAGLVVNFFHPLLFTVPMLAYHLVRRHLGSTPALVALPFIWATYEFLAQLPELTFPWLILANTQTYQPAIIRFISFTGAYGVSFWIVAINVLCFVFIRRLRSGDMRLFSTGSVRALGVLVLVFIGPSIVAYLVEPSPVRSGSIRIGIVQPNIDPYEKWSATDTPAKKLIPLVTLYDSIVRVAAPELVLFPETAIPFRILMPEYRGELAWLRRHIDSVGVPLVTGFPDLVWYVDRPAPAGAKRVPGAEYRYDDFNSAMLLTAGNAAPQIYHKSRLTPMSERVPYMEYLPFLENALNWGVGISSWGLGRDTTVFTLARRNAPAVRFWPMICYETLFPGFIAGFAARGAEFLAVITNDGWFGPTSGPYQLERYTVLRALENRRAVARCANNGISCFIDENGRVTKETALYTRTAIAAEIPTFNSTTYFTRTRDGISAGIMVVLAGILAAGFIHKHRKTTRRHNG